MLASNGELKGLELTLSYRRRLQEEIQLEPLMPRQIGDRPEGPIVSDIPSEFQ